ncbi:phage/plasmid primase, P4 family [Paenalcaligenes niemegkensis]|uniref:phage/plasmid primase, P4 family n=1 Tax=Paenalcaligenes niemegkensis TaxID=2895469 RepID=UPI001EE9329B|nr:phage/plasmid primase, P4 family [Paenalcaligenes niemegkensis]MCQ9615404.1 phage/plasmid primase, P4 family [Paenalcaligenes niemegkensis]
MGKSIRDTHAFEFLESLGGADDGWYFRTLPECPGAHTHIKNFTGGLDKNLTLLRAANAAGAGIFVVVNPGGDKDLQITDIAGVWLDLDAKDFKDEDDYRQALRMASEGRYLPSEQKPADWPEPSLLVKSGGGAHVYWVLAEKSCPVTNFKTAQQALARKFGGDPAVCNPARLMRVPGFMHWKTGEPKSVVLQNCKLDLVYDLDDLLSRLDVSIDATPAPASTIGAPIANGRPDTPINVAALRTALLRISADCSRIEWLKILCSIKAHGFSESEQIARKWSTSAPDRYNEEDFTKNWNSLSIEGGVTPSTVYWLAGPEPEACPDPRTDDGMACRFTEWLGGRAMYARGEWHCWTGAYWKPDTATVQHLLKSYAKEYARQSLEDFMRNPEDGKSKANKQASHRLLDVPKQANVLTSLCVMLRTPDESLDANPMLLCVPNGQVDLRTGKLLAPDPKQWHTRCAGIPFNPSAQCPQWLHFLDQTFQNDKTVIAYVQRWFGYMMSGSVQEEKLLFGFGTGRNGKSVLANILAHILGTYCGQADSSLLTSGRRDGAAASPEIARLAGLRLALLNETQAGGKWDDHRIKSLVSTEKVVARKLYGEPFAFRPTAKLFVRGNNRPQIADTSEGMWRRLDLLDFPNRLSVQQADMGLEARLKAEGSGILAWSIRGCLDWQEQGLATPSSVDAAVESYRGVEDVIREWIEDRLDYGGFTSRRGLIEDYAQNSGTARPPSDRTFYQRLRDHGFVETKNSGVRGFKVSLKPDDVTF